MNAADIGRALAERIDPLARELLPNGVREGHEWRAGNVHGDRGSSLGAHLSGPKAGIWSDFATGEAGDALDLVAGVLGVDKAAALRWSRCWLGLESGTAVLPVRSTAVTQNAAQSDDPDRWRRPWQKARPIADSLAEVYLRARGLRFEDPAGRVLRFTARRARLSPTGELEHHPALLCALSDARDGRQCGIINVYLQLDGSDRLRDKKGKTVTGRAAGAVVMLSAFDAPTMGLVLCEGVETGIALYQREICPVWACGAAGTLAQFPTLSGIEALTIALDADDAGRRAAGELARRWQQSGREVLEIEPPIGDWAELRP